MSGWYGAYSKSTRISKITELGKTWEYAYDAGGLITSEKRGGTSGQSVTYEYDHLGQLIRANDPFIGTTWTYAYDLGGNLLECKRYAYTIGSLDGASVLSNDTYVYGDANWKDKLTGFNDAPITYDAIGNPLNDGTWSYTWQHGCQLAQMQNDYHTVDFAYNHAGLRVRKMVDGIVTDYTLRGNQVVHMTKGNTQLHFYYDAAGKPCMVTYNGVDYYYIYNLQGDVIALANTAKQIVVEYSYDPWGNPLPVNSNVPPPQNPGFTEDLPSSLGITGSLADTLGLDNPFRYRAYLFDNETGLYYLRSRYYRPALRRFVNADSVLGSGSRLLSHNVYAYCANNPVMMRDPSGMRFNLSVAGSIPHTDDAVYAAAGVKPSPKPMQTGSGKGNVASSSGSALEYRRDVTEEINQQLNIYREIAENSRSMVGWNFGLFISWVDKEAPWDIKVEKSWKDTIKTDFPGRDVYVSYEGYPMTPEQLGNFTYGYLGAALNLPALVLVAGSVSAAGWPNSKADIDNELGDWEFIQAGINWYYSTLK
jgi:RHS repeat-associated protein